MSKQLDLTELFTQEQVERAAEAVAKVVMQKATDDLQERFYSEIESYLYEIFDNAERGIKQRLVRQICSDFAENPTEYDYQQLRAKLFDETQGQLTKTLTDYAIFEEVERVVMQYTHKKSLFAWHWQRGIVDVVKKNWQEIREMEHFKSAMEHEINRLLDENNRLRIWIKELEGADND